MSEKNCKAKCEEHLDEEMKAESPGETKQGDLPSIITTDALEPRHIHFEFDFGEVKKETSGESPHLESLREYSSRIKAFLGWDCKSDPSADDLPDRDLAKDDYLETEDFSSPKHTVLSQGEADVSSSETDGALGTKTDESASRVTTTYHNEIPSYEHYNTSNDNLNLHEVTQELFETISPEVVVGSDIEAFKEREILGSIYQKPIMNENLLQENNASEKGLILNHPADLIIAEEGCNNSDDSLPDILLNQPLDEKHNDFNPDTEEIVSGIRAFSNDEKHEHWTKEQEYQKQSSSAIEEKSVPNLDDVRKLSLEVVNDVMVSATAQLQDVFSNKNIETFDENSIPLTEENAKISSNNKEHADAWETTQIENGLVDSKESGLQARDQQLLNGKEEKCQEPYSDGNETKLNNEIELKNAVESHKSGNVVHNSPIQLKKKMLNEISEKQESDENTICGIGSFRPKWIQKWATARNYLILYSLIGVLQGSYYTYLIGIISTLEKRFAFKSKISGTIMLADEISPLFLGVLVGYFGGKAHRPRIVAIGMLLSALCCFISALPYFIYGTAQHLTSITVHNKTGPELCNDEVKEQFCETDERPPTLAAVLFLLLGSFMKGFGNVAYYAVGLTYMDDNAKKKNSPIYLAVAFTFRLLGPFTGFLMSSAFLNFYENPFDDPGYGPDDPRWIGGWWMGFVLQGVLLTIFTLPFFLFPRRLPGHNNPQDNQESTERESFVSTLKGLFAALKRLGKNPVFIFHVLHTISAVFGSFGHYIMLPKYMENQFRLSASDASLYSGPPGLAAIMAAIIFGGVIIWKYKPSVKVLTAGMVMTEVIATVSFLLLMIPKCEKIDMFNSGFSEEGLILDNICNYNCNCSTTELTPVCGPNGKTTFFSPCYAGCSLSKNKDKVYTNCSCGHVSEMHTGVFTEGYCKDEGCWSQALYYIVYFPIFQALISVLHVAHTMVLLRCVHPEDKSIALGVYEALLSLLAFIPYPIVFGAMVDSTCLVWEETCGETGNCWFYDMKNFNYLLHGIAALSTAFGGLSTFAVYCLRGRLYDFYEDSDKNVMKKKEFVMLKLDTVSNNVIRL